MKSHSERSLSDGLRKKITGLLGICEEKGRRWIKPEYLNYYLHFLHLEGAKDLNWEHGFQLKKDQYVGKGRDPRGQYFDDHHARFVNDIYGPGATYPSFSQIRQTARDFFLAQLKIGLRSISELPKDLLISFLKGKLSRSECYKLIIGSEGPTAYGLILELAALKIEQIQSQTGCSYFVLCELLAFGIVEEIYELDSKYQPLQAFEQLLLVELDQFLKTIPRMYSGRDSRGEMLRYLFDNQFFVPLLMADQLGHIETGKASFFEIGKYQNFKLDPIIINLLFFPDIYFEEKNKKLLFRNIPDIEILQRIINWAFSFIEEEKHFPAIFERLKLILSKFGKNLPYCFTILISEIGLTETIFNVLLGIDPKTLEHLKQAMILSYQEDKNQQGDLIYDFLMSHGKISKEVLDQYLIDALRTNPTFGVIQKLLVVKKAVELVELGFAELIWQLILLKVVSRRALFTEGSEYFGQSNSGALPSFFEVEFKRSPDSELKALKFPELVRSGYRAFQTENLIAFLQAEGEKAPVEVKNYVIEVLGDKKNRNILLKTDPNFELFVEVYSSLTAEERIQIVVSHARWSRKLTAAFEAALMQVGLTVEIQTALKSKDRPKEWHACAYNFLLRNVTPVGIDIVWTRI